MRILKHGVPRTGFEAIKSMNVDAKTAMPTQPSVPPMPNPNSNYRPPAAKSFGTISIHLKSNMPCPYKADVYFFESHVEIYFGKAMISFTCDSEMLKELKECIER